VPAALGGLLILLAVQAVYSVGAAVASPPVEMLASARWLSAVSPVAQALSTVLVFPVLLVAAVRRVSAPPLYLCGAGLVVFAAGLAIIALSGGESAVGYYLLGAVVTGLGEAAAGAVPTAYAAVAVRGRAATLVLAGWLAVLALVRTASHALTGSTPVRIVLLVGSALLTLAAGGALLAFSPRLHCAFFDPVAPGGTDLEPS
jgi:hypothetical protein